MRLPSAAAQVLVLVAAFAALLAPMLAHVAYAQNETNTTNTTSTNTTATNTTTTPANITLPSAPTISPIQRGEATVSAYYVNGTVIVYYTCYYLGSPNLCPEATYTLAYPNGTAIRSASYAVDPQHDCANNVCKYRITMPAPANTTRLLFTYTLKWSDGETKTYRIMLTEQKPANNLADMIPALIPLAVTVGLAIQYNIAIAGVGAIASVAVLYLLSVAGITSFNPLVANLAIITGIILIYFSRR